MLSWGGGVCCCGGFAAAVLPSPPLLPVLLLCPFGLQLQQWSWTVGLGVLQHTHAGLIACRECIVIAPVPQQGVVVATKAACRTLHCLGILRHVCLCVRAPVRIDQEYIILILECVCAECV